MLLLKVLMVQMSRYQEKDTMSKKWIPLWDPFFMVFRIKICLAHFVMRADGYVKRYVALSLLA